MNGRRLIPLLASLAILASACTQQNTGDEPAASTAPQGLNRFLLFPNPVSMNSGGFETNTATYATAYYAAIDPNDDKNTLDKWKVQNQFGNPSTGTEELAVFRDTKDLGYGRRMTGRRNNDSTIAFYVENYNVAPTAGSGYASVLNVEAAIKRDTQWHVGTNAIEWSTAPCSAAELAEGCNPNVKFAKYYNFSSRDGTRQLAVDLDGKGLKSMPGPCITCHGGRGDPLTPADATGKPRFPLVENSVSRKRGDVQARLHGMNVDSFGFSPDILAFSKTAQQDVLKDFNQWILCTYPSATVATVTSTGPSNWGTCTRPTADLDEWQGTAAEMIQSWYSPLGSTTMTNATFADIYVPTGWQAAAAGAAGQDLYTNVVVPYCRTCHILRGTNNQSDIDFMTFAKFMSYADRIKAHVFDRGTMPLALIVYNDFWGSNAPTQLANTINPALTALNPPQTAIDSSGAALRPGRPIANPGPNRMVKTATPSTLTGENSLFASSFRWEVAGGTASIADPNAMITSVTVPSVGAAQIRLTVSSGALSDSKTITITADDTFPDPATLKFAQVKDVLQNVVHQTSQPASVKCVLCHVTPLVTPTPPIIYSNFDRDGSGGAPDSTDDDWFLKALAGRVNLTEIDASPLLRKPAGNHHNGADPFNLTTGVAGLRNYSIVYHWIVGGMRPGGLIANAGANSTNNVAFTGSPLGATVALDGSGSVGATGYAWSITSATPAAHPNGTAAAATPPSITGATSQAATLNVFDIGTYVVRLTVSNGTDPVVFAERTITVTESAVTGTAALPSGTQTLTFAGNPATAIVNLSTSSTTGSPQTFSWVYFPTGLTTGGCGTITSNTLAAATLTVPVADVNTTCSIRVFASNLSTTGVATTSITIAANATQSPNTLSFTVPAVSIGFTIQGSLANATATIINGNLTNTISMTGSAQGLAPLSFSWSVPVSGTAGCSIFGSSTLTTVSIVISKAGTCSVTMTVTNAISSASLTKTVTATSSVVFSTVAGILTSAGCSGCHVGAGQTPSWVNDAGLFGRITGTAGVVNTVTPRNSLFLVCPSAGCSATNTNTNTVQTMGGGQPGFATGNFANYDSFLTWITNGATNP
jgi:mono/diheme cytochrome c family protein